jgi:hypothetical protein
MPKWGNYAVHPDAGRRPVDRVRLRLISPERALVAMLGAPAGSDEVAHHAAPADRAVDAALPALRHP